MDACTVLERTHQKRVLRSFLQEVFHTLRAACAGSQAKQPSV